MLFLIVEHYFPQDFLSFRKILFYLIFLLMKVDRFIRYKNCIFKTLCSILDVLHPPFKLNNLKSPF